MLIIGEVAGLLTSILFAANAFVVTRAAVQVGSTNLNRTRVVFALIYLLILNSILYHQPLPFNAEQSRWTWLALSGVIGLALGDAFLFQAYITVGPRLGTLLLSLSTVFSAIEARLFFGESLRLGQVLGIALALGGTIWVILEQGNGNTRLVRPPGKGILFGILAALGQATGLVLSKQGMLGNFSPLSGNAIRMLAAVLALWLLAVLQNQAGKTIQTLRANPSAIKLVAVAALIGPVAGVSLSLLAVQNAPVGVASVLTSLSPIFMIPMTHYVFKERIGWQSIAGTLVAMVGVAVLFLV